MDVHFLAKSLLCINSWVFCRYGTLLVDKVMAKFWSKAEIFENRLDRLSWIFINSIKELKFHIDRLQLIVTFDSGRNSCSRTTINFMSLGITKHISPSGYNPLFYDGPAEKLYFGHYLGHQKILRPYCKMQTLLINHKSLNLIHMKLRQFQL